MLLVVSSALDPKAFCRYVAGVLPSSVGVLPSSAGVLPSSVGVLPSSVGVDLVFGGIVDRRRIKPAILLKGLVRI